MKINDNFDQKPPMDPTVLPLPLVVQTLPAVASSSSSSDPKVERSEKRPACLHIAEQRTATGKKVVNFCFAIQLHN